MKEADLYPPIKAYLEGQGYMVKSEIGACDIMARRGDEPAVIVEMKTTFSLSLVMQGVARQGMFDDVYLAVPLGPKGWAARYKDIVALCRRLGLGLLAVRDGVVEAHVDPAPYHPRKNTLRAGRLLREFDRRLGDPNTGGTTGVKRVTAYHQDSLRCLWAVQQGAVRGADVVKMMGVARATQILRDNYSGWFVHVSRGVYGLSLQGERAIDVQKTEILAILETNPLPVSG
jgi:hypothetical protein